MFRADKQSRKWNNQLKGLGREGEVRPGESIAWTDEIKNIPPVPASRLGAGCNNIDVKYLLTVSMLGLALVGWVRNFCTEQSKME